MSKTLDIIMAGIISGIVAFTTSQLGVTGTIIGAVIGSMLYQFMSHFFKDPLENVNTLKTPKRVESQIVYAFPLIIILAIEIIYLLSSFYLGPREIFQSMQTATDWNLFRTIGVGLIIMGVYPLLEPDRIPPIYGLAVLGVGVVKLMAGFVDYNSPIVALYSPIFQHFNVLISIVLIAVLLYVIVSIIQDSVTIIRKEDQSKNSKGELREIEL
jgi:hypothetical protein